MGRLALLLACWTTLAAARPDPARTAVLVNTDQPAGLAIAREFMAHRGIPAANLIALPLGLLLTRQRRFANAAMAVVNILRTVPSLALLVIMLPLLGTEFVPKADFSETSVNFHTPAGSSLQTTEAKAREVEAILRSFPEVKYTLSTINVGDAQGKIYATVYVRLVDRKDRTLNADAMAAKLRERLRSVPGITAIVPSQTWTAAKGACAG
jgi:multidrug efflux pump subunit AcrB